VDDLGTRLSRRQIAVAILWAVPALCFLPFIYVTVIAWLGGSAGSAPGRIVQPARRLASPAPRLAFTAHPAMTTFQAHAPSG